jgi:hypothetical protein
MTSSKIRTSTKFWRERLFHRSCCWRRRWWQKKAKTKIGKPKQQTNKATMAANGETQAEASTAATRHEEDDADDDDDDNVNNITGTSTDDDNDDDDEDDVSESNAEELEARAIARAMQSADSAYVPSPSLLASDDPHALLSQVDGPNLIENNIAVSQPSVYQAKSVPVALRAKFEVPIHVTAGGSVVQFEISTEEYDIAFGVTAEREEGITIVKESMRVNSHLEPITGKFLVGSVPCALIFSFDNEYSWFREKKVSYKITVSPPRMENVIRGRRLRAQKALEVLTREKEEVTTKHQLVASKRSELEAKVAYLTKTLAETQTSLEEIVEKESVLEKKRNVREEQIKLLNLRLEKGWEDERAEV